MNDHNKVSGTDHEKMVGFDAEFRDLDHYIRAITERIWEGRRVDDIYAYYSDLCIVETPSSVSLSVDDVVSGTKATLAQFPDRRLLAEDIRASHGERERAVEFDRHAIGFVLSDEV